MTELQSKREEFGITVIGIYPTSNDRGAIDDVVKEFRLNYPINVEVQDPEAVGARDCFFGQYAVDAIPHAVLINRRGNVGTSGEPSELIAKTHQIARGLTRSR